MLPNPWHTPHAPNGLLNENSRGCGTSVLDGAAAALEALAEAVDNSRRGACPERRGIGKLNGKGGATALGVGRLDRVGEPGAQVAVDLHAVDDHLQHGAILERGRIDLVQ